MRSKFGDYCQGRVNLTAAIAAKAKSLADAAQQAANAAASTANWPTVSGIPLRFADPAPEGPPGLFMGTDHMGYYASGAWKTYIRNDGSFYFGGKDANSFVRWDGGAADLLIRGKLTADDIQSGGTIKGVTIEGSTLRTAATGKRFEVREDTHEARFYNSDGNRVVTLGYNEPLIGPTQDQCLFTLGSFDTDFISPDLNYPIYAIMIQGKGNFHGINVSTNSYYDSLTETTMLPGPCFNGATDSAGVGIRQAYGGTGTAILGDAYGQGAVGVRGNSNYGHAVLGWCLAAGKFAFYAQSSNGAGAYGPFTGAHEALVPKNFEFEVGDILEDEEILNRPNVSDAIGTARLTASTKSVKVLGVVSGKYELTVEGVKAVSALLERQALLL